MPLGTMLALLSLARPVNVVVACASVYVGAFLSSGGWSVPWGTVVAVGATLAAANVDNDLQDVTADRINHPHRPLVRAHVNPQYAALWRSGLTIVALLAAVWAGLQPMIITGAVLLLLAVYNRQLKHVPLWGNIVVSLAAMLALWISAPVHQWLQAPLVVGAGFAGLTTFLREIVKDAQDRAGDEAVHSRTLATTRSDTTVSRIAMLGLSVVLLGVLLLTATYPGFGLSGVQDGNLLDLNARGVVSLILTTLLCSAVIISTLGKVRTYKWAAASRLLKVCMVVGIVFLTVRFA